MLPQLIAKYLKDNRRLNIPGLGVFMVKGDGGIIFSELLKSDDGVLRALLKQEGIGDIEAAAAIDRFIFELRYELKPRGACCSVEGLGVFTTTDDGQIIFSQAEAPKEETVILTKEEAVILPKEETAPVAQTTHKIKEFYSDQMSFRESRELVGDLSYTKKQKPLGGYAYAKSRVKPRRRGVDRVLMFGVVAAVLALMVIAYGCYVANVEAVELLMVEWGLKIAG